MGKFKTKARAIELLGKKQIRDSVTALSELMKNAYDADAGQLRVEFNTKDVSTPFIAIYDTGIGMDAYDVDNKWLVLGTESKKVDKQISTPKGRILMGEKGIGRLAVSKLGQQTILLTKKKSSKWNIVYLNWNVFENPYLMIEEIVIPERFNVGLDDISRVLDELVEEQKENLKSMYWKSEEVAKLRGILEEDEEKLSKIPEIKEIVELREKVDKQIQKLVIPTDEILDICDWIEEQENQGTIILSFDLNEIWDNYLNLKKRDSNQKSMDERNYDKLAAFISDFQHVDKNFSVEVLYNGYLQIYNYDYNEEDYNKYDLKIEGKISKGQFWGHLDARNADKKLLEECNQELQKGLNVTSGINNWKEYDCGEFFVKFCHVELAERNTGLSKEEFDEITKKMLISGGIAVYRDNMRILPYGEVGNDFLELERQRTNRAGDFIFSHRNVFGRIDISSKSNPLLEDKSSREGLIENEQYYYFLTTLQNLLIRLAKDFLNGNATSMNLRNSYVSVNNQRTEEKKKKEEAEKEENKREKEYIREIRKQAKNNLKESKALFKKIEDMVNGILIIWESEDDNYIYWSKQKGDLKKKIREIKKNIDVYKKFRIHINERYKAAFEESDIENINFLNDKIEEESKNFIEKCNDNAKKQAEFIDERLTDWIETAKGQMEYSPLEYIDYLKQQIKQISVSMTESEKAVKVECKEKEERLLQKFHIVSDLQSKIIQIKRKILKEISQGKTNFTPKMENLIIQCDKLTQMTAEQVSEKEKEIVKQISLLEKELLEFLDEENAKLHNQYDELNKQVDLMTFYLQDENIQETQQLLGLLKEKNIELQNQVDMYAELANTGLAADIVNHEFNQLFTNVYDAIKQMKFQQMSSDAKYYLKEIEVGFRAISSRQSQLSPMYRSRSTNKRIMVIRNMIEDMKKFFEEQLKESKIVFNNEVPDGEEIFISESGIYPVLSNIIYNSLYWLADQEYKEILFHYEREEHALYVEDSGCGIETRNLEKIFEPFFSLKRIPRGLGLTISRKVLEKQGHSIKAINDSEKKVLDGACFVITFNDNTNN